MCSLTPFQHSLVCVFCVQSTDRQKPAGKDVSCENGERQFPGPQDSLADALEGGLLADTATIGVDATLEKERKCEGTETSEWHLHSLHCRACPLWPHSGPGKNWEPHPSRAKPSLPAFYVTPSRPQHKGRLSFFCCILKSREHTISAVRALCRHQPTGCSDIGRGWVRRAWRRHQPLLPTYYPRPSPSHAHGPH